MPPIQTGLNPIVGRASSVLVLGSFPGPESLARGEYYAFHRNRFWALMERVIGIDPLQRYARRTQAIHPRIKVVVFNGRKAETTFRRFVLTGLGSYASKLSLNSAPSTSPANARYSLSALERAWRLALF